MKYISPKAEIENGCYIGNNVKIYGNCVIKSGTIIEDGCVIGKPSRIQLFRLRDDIIYKMYNTVVDDYSLYDEVVNTKTIIGEGTILQQGTIIYSGVVLGQNVFCEDNCIIRWDSKIGDNTKIMFTALVSSYITVGKNCRIGGFCCNDAVIGDYTSMFGQLTHSYTKYGGGRRDKAPKIGSQVTTGFGSQVIGDVIIGDGSYLAAGSIVTKNIPPHSVVLYHNEIQSLSNWNGRLHNEYLNSFKL